VKTTLKETRQPVNLVVEGRATIDGRDVVREAVPAEDRMQAFLWRHLVPAGEMKALVYDPSLKPPPKRVPPPLVAGKPDKAAPAASAPAGGMQEMASSATPAPTGAAKPDKAAPAAPPPPPAVKPDKAGPAAPAAPAPEKPKFTKQQVEGRLRQLKILYEDWLLTDEFYARMVAECEASR